MSWANAAVWLTPDTALVLFTLGLLLIFIELNRPGAVLPGTCGLLLGLLAVASLARLHLSAAGLALIFTATALLLLGLIRPIPAVVAAAATLALCLGFDQLVTGPGHARIDARAAAPCGLVLGAASYALTRIARRARANKAVD